MNIHRRTYDLQKVFPEGACTLDFQGVEEAEVAAGIPRNKEAVDTRPEVAEAVGIQPLLDHLHHHRCQEVLRRVLLTPGIHSTDWNHDRNE